MASVQRLFSVVCLAVVIGVISTAAQQKEYTLRIDVRAADGGSIKGTKVRIIPKIAGSKVFDVRSADVIFNDASGAYFTIDEMGFALAFLAPGTYQIEVTNRFYKKAYSSIEVPQPGKENETTRAISVSLARAEQDLRKLTVSVQGEKRDAAGKLTTFPLPFAKIAVVNDESAVTFAGSADANGKLLLEMPFIIGTEVKVSVSAVGFDPQEKTHLIGSWQEVNRDDRRTTTSDHIDFKLVEKGRTARDLKEKENRARSFLVVEAVNAKTRAPIPGANVEVELIELAGMPFATGKTSAFGKTRPFEVPPLQSSEKHAEMRIKVKARGFNDKWSDIPYGVAVSGETRNYVIHLDPIAEPKAVATSNPYNLPAQLKNKTVTRTEKLDPILECWAPDANSPCYTPNMEAQVTIYYFSDGSNYWDRRDYDAKRAANAKAGMAFRWACGKSLWKNGRCG